MSDEEPDDLEEMELPRRTWLTLPLSFSLFRLLSTLESNREYFETTIDGDDSRVGKERKLALYFHYGFYDRSRWYVVPFVAFMIVLAMDSCGIWMIDLPLQAYGLALDAGGGGTNNSAWSIQRGRRHTH